MTWAPRTPPTVTDELSARLLEQLGAPAMIEPSVWAALANQAARTNFAPGIEAQGFSAASRRAPLAQPGAAGTAGRRSVTGMTGDPPRLEHGQDVA
jgi:hypothetical protein